MARPRSYASPDSKAGSVTTRRQRSPKIPGGVSLTPDGRLVGNDAISKAIEATRPGAIAQAKKQSSETIRRQQLLKSLGYGVVVDGQWGPRSQKAWQDYAAKRAKSPTNFSAIKPETSRGRSGLPVAERVRQNTNLVTPEEIRTNRVVRRERIRKKAQERIAIERAAILKRGREIQLSPVTARNLTLRQLVETVTDRETNLNPATSRSGAVATQEWLNANGFRVAVTGKYDRQTHDAFQRAESKAIQAERVKRTRALRYRVYRLLPDVRPGDRPSWWKLNRPIPTPDELADELGRGTFESDMMLRALTQQAFTGMAAFNQIRHAELLKLARQFAPFGSAQIVKLLNDPNAVSNGSLLLDLLGVNNLAPAADTSGLSPTQAAYADQQWVNNPQIRAENAKRVGRFRAEVGALAKATDAEDFKRKLLAYSRVEEIKFTRFQKQLAGESIPWWGQALHKILAPGEFMRTALTYDVMRGSQLLFGDGERAVQWEDAAVTLGADPDDFYRYDGAVDKAANRLLRIGFELTADPINFAHPFRTASAFLKYSTKGSQLGAYGLRGGIREADNFILRTRSDDVAGGLYYTRGTWSKRSMYDTLTGGVFADAPHRTLRNKVVASKNVALASARERASWTARHGFKQVKLADGTVAQKAGKIPKKVRALLDESRPAMMAVAREMPELRPLLDALIEGRASLYVDKGRRYYSNVGASLLANLAEKSRVAASNQLGVDYAWKTFDSNADDWFQANPMGIEIPPRIMDGIESPITARDVLEAASTQHPSGWQVAVLSDYRRYGGTNEWLRSGQIARQEWADLAQAEYVNMVESAGAYIKGGAASKEIQKITGYAATSSMDEVESTWIPVIQDILEQEADAVFEGAKSKATTSLGESAASVTHPLWDEGELWAGRSGEMATALRELGRESFEKEVAIPNPQSGIAHTWGEASELIEAEIRRRSPRVLGYASRGIAGGQLPDGFVVTDELAKIRADVVNSWKKEGGDWFDTRETIMVSDLYARNQGKTFEASADWFRRGREGRFQSENPWIMAPAQLAETPMFSGASRTDDGLWKLTWMMGGRYKQLPAKRTATLGRRDIPKPPPGMPAEHLTDFFFEEFQRGQMIYDAVQKHQFAISSGFDSAVSVELAKDGAIMRAMAHAEAAPLRWAYLGLKGMMDVWVFATLPLRPGWMVRNVIDNVAKAITMGVRDPRAYFIGGNKPGSLVHSVFDMGLTEIRHMIMWLDSLFGTHAADYWMTLENSIWELGSDALGRIFKAHGVDVPSAVLEQSLLQPAEGWGKRASIRYDVESVNRQLGTGLKTPKRPGEENWAQRFRDGAWELMGNRPESYFKRVIYRDEFMKAERRLAGTGTESEVAVAAHQSAWAKVEETLFDYSNISVIEDNFRVFFPFIQFWRKNTMFWLNAVASKPWLNNTILQLDQARREAHKDLPGWMQRYLHVDEITDAVAFVPGLDKVVNAMLPDDIMYDPANLLSFAPFYRAFKETVYGESQAVVPSTQTGWPIIGPMLDALSDWGLGPAPWVRKPLETAQVASDRSWQSAFPQTNVMTAMTRKWFGENVAGKLADWAAWERVFTLYQGDQPSDVLADNFTYYVQQEVAGQVARGEKPNWDKASDEVKAGLAVKQLWGYFTGMYFRGATTEDVYLSKLQDEMITGEREKFTDKEWKLIRLWGMRGMDRVVYQKYIDLVPLIEAYYRSDDWQTKVRLKAEHPELTQWVDAAHRGRPFKSKWTRNAQKYVDTQKFMMAMHLVEIVDPPFAIRDSIIDSFKTPELEAYWRENDSTAQRREQMTKASVFEYFNELNQQYHSIADDDFEAKDGFLDANPELVRHWNRNNDPADDYDAVVSSANAAAREMYFALVKQNGGGSKGFNAAAPILKSMPFIFEDTKSAKKVDPVTGEWINGMKSDGTWKESWSSDRSNAFREAQPNLKWFFDQYMPRVGQKSAWAWLETSDSDAAVRLKDYFKKYGKQSAKSLAYMKAAPWLTIFFDMPEAVREKWLRGDSEGAEIVRWYFDNYAGETGHTQHARDYLAVKGQLDHYFSIPKQKRREWLNGGSEAALAVLDYFKKYGSAHKQERAFKRLGSMTGGTPEQKRRLDFWREFYALPPDQRPAFIFKNAERAGVFIYGEFGQVERHDREQEYLRHAVDLGASERQAVFLYVKPLLDFYYTLPDNERALFLRANPEVQEYLDKYSDGSVTGDAKLDALVDRYFGLPPDSLARSQFLKDHAQVQDWFDERSSPSARAMHNVLEQYFSLKEGHARKDFLIQHPEISAYFEARRRERESEMSITDAFDRSDPRLKPFWDDAAEMLTSAEYVRDRLKRSAMNALAADSYSSRRERSGSR